MGIKRKYSEAFSGLTSDSDIYIIFSGRGTMKKKNSFKVDLSELIHKT
jgi:hypothetical protein